MKREKRKGRRDVFERRGFLSFRPTFQDMTSSEILSLSITRLYYWWIYCWPSSFLLLVIVVGDDEFELVERQARSSRDVERRGHGPV